MAIDYSKLRDFDPGRILELDRRVDGEIYHEVEGRKRGIEESRAKKRKKAKKQRKQQESSRNY